MTPEQAKSILDLLNASWPDYEPPEETVVLWLHDLVHLQAPNGIDPYDVAIGAVRTLRDRCTFYPKWAEFLDAVTAVNRGHRVAAMQVTAAGRELEAPRTEPKAVAQHFRDMRAALRKTKDAEEAS